MSEQNERPPRGLEPGEPSGSGLTSFQEHNRYSNFNADEAFLGKFLALGWKIFPCHSIVNGRCTCPNPGCDKPGKHPRTQHGFKDASSDPAVVERWLGKWGAENINWAVATGQESGIVVVDIDPRNGGNESMVDYTMPPTLSVATGGNGQHLFFAYPDGEPVKSNGGWLPGVDVQSDGKYVILPGSRHMSGGVYSWENDAELAALPPEVGERSAGGSRFELPDSASILAGVEKGERNDTLFRWAVEQKHRNFMDADGGRAIVTTLVLGAAKASGLDEREALQIVESAFRQDYGKPTAAEDFYGVPLPEGEKHDFTDGGTFLFDVPALPPAIWGFGSEILWARNEALMVCGGIGAGKTTIMGQLVRAMIFGGDVLGYPVTPLAEGDKILYLAMDRPEQIRRALARQFNGHDRETTAQRLVVWKGPPPEDMAKNVYLLRDMCREVGAKTVFIDSLKDAAVGLTDDVVGAGYNRARQKAVADGIQVIEGHHQIKRAVKTLDDVYGSVWLAGGAGSVILLYGEPGSEIVEFRHLKPVMEPVGAFKIIHDHVTGESRVWAEDATDPLVMARAAGSEGITATALAAAIYGTATDKRLAANNQKKAHRALEKLVAAGSLFKRPKDADGFDTPDVYVVGEQS